MARYRYIDLSPRLLPVDLEVQLVPGTFAHAVHHLVDALDLLVFDTHQRTNAKTRRRQQRIQPHLERA